MYNDTNDLDSLDGEAIFSYITALKENICCQTSTSLGFKPEIEDSNQDDRFATFD